ncbi:MAG: transglutaminase-like domain-containing protein [Armatimonadota bacterium]|nr:transglutaminase-like domain-containing protein [Armatimonadota bacterium]
MSASFAEAVNVPGEQINLAEAALWIARDAYPGLEIEPYLHRLDVHATAIRSSPAGRAYRDLVRLASAKGAGEETGKGDSEGPMEAARRGILEAFNEYLFNQLDFHGNREDYYDPRNSYLNDVLDRRTGLPISLSVIYLEIGWRLGLPLVGIGLPGHFIVAWFEPDEPLLFVDPFSSGAVLSVRDCQARVNELFGQPIMLQREWLQPVGRRSILMRMLNNLKGLFLRLDQIDKAIPVVEKQLILYPKSAEDTRDLGILHAQAGHRWEALSNLERYLALRPDAADADQVQQIQEALFGDLSGTEGL